jgi:LytR cell envelope-related transcriptional attenuator
VTIPGRGDLAPRRRKRRTGRNLAIFVIVALLAAGGYAGYARYIRGSSGRSPATAIVPLCPKLSTASEFAPARQVNVAVFNASLRTGLAAAVAATLRHRGFHIAAVGNALRVGHNVATIRYSPDERRAYRSVAAQIPGEATIKPVVGHHILELDLGVHFRRLQSAAAARASERRLVAAEVRTASPSPSPSPSCRPRA